MLEGLSTRGDALSRCGEGTSATLSFIVGPEGLPAEVAAVAADPAVSSCVEREAARATFDFADAPTRARLELQWEEAE